MRHPVVYGAGQHARAGLSEGAKQRADGEHRQAAAAEALDRLARRGAGERAEQRRRRQQIGEGEEVDQPRRAEVLLADIERGVGVVAQTRQEAEAVGDDQGAGGGQAEAEDLDQRRAARRLFAPADS